MLCLAPSLFLGEREGPDALSSSSPRLPHAKGGEFYGPGGPYNLFTGVDAGRALAKMSFKPEDLAGGVDDLTQSEKDILFDWEQKFQMKYKHVGDLVD